MTVMQFIVVALLAVWLLEIARILMLIARALFEIRDLLKTTFTVETKLYLDGHAVARALEQRQRSTVIHYQ